MSSESLPEVARQNIRTVRELEARVARRRSRADRVSAAVSRFAGSFVFLMAQVLFCLAWCATNLLLPPERAFDPFPFFFLAFLLGVEMVVLSTFVLMNQNRQSRENEHWEHVRLQVDLLAEHEATKVLQMLRAICAQLGLDQVANDPELAQIIETTRLAELAREVEKVRTPTGPAPAEPPGSRNDFGENG